MRLAAQDLAGLGRLDSRERLSGPAGAVVAESRSVMATTLFGSAPWSPLPLTVDVSAQIVAVPFRLTRPVMLRRPSVAGAHGRPVP